MTNETDHELSEIQNEGMRAAWEKWNRGEMGGGLLTSCQLAHEADRLSASIRSPDMQPIDMVMVASSLTTLAAALRRAETARDAALRQSAAWEIQAQDMRDRLVKAEAERDAQHDLVLRLTAERDALVFQGAEVEHAMLLAADERDEFAAALDKARAQVWGLICVATNCAIKADESFPALRQLLDQRDELTATRDLLTAENTRLQKERDEDRAELEHSRGNVWALMCLFTNEDNMGRHLKAVIKDLRAQVATLELLRRGGK